MLSFIYKFDQGKACLRAFALIVFYKIITR